MKSQFSLITALAISRCFMLGHATSFLSDSTQPSTGTPPCDALIAAGLGDRVLLATNPAYEEHLSSFWSYNTRLRPWCFMQPRTAEEVSLALRILVPQDDSTVDWRDGAGDWHIAVRSGGHSLAASNCIADGVTIDLGMMTEVTYDAESNLAGVGPGWKWMNVYRELGERYGVSVVGGRDGDVGVGGFLTGGGISYYSPRKGLACDNVVSMQVVLANGSIVAASKQENDDLYLALKGGSLNTGIVTRFDLEAFPAKNLTSGEQIMYMNQSKAFAQAVVDFIDAQGPDDVLVPTFLRLPDLGNETVILAIKVNTVGDQSTTAFDQISKIPSIEDTGMISMSMADAAAASQIDGGLRTFWRTLTFANDVGILNHLIELQEDFVSKLLEFLPSDAFNIASIPQPWPLRFIEASTAKGKNMLGLENSKRNGILWTGGAQLYPNKTTEADFARAQVLVNEWAAGIEDYARKAGGFEEYVALNYADASQDPLKTYGNANVEFLRGVAEKYDPTRVFQYRIPGGFKVSRVV